MCQALDNQYYLWVFFFEISYRHRLDLPTVGYCIAYNNIILLLINPPASFLHAALILSIQCAVWDAALHGWSHCDSVWGFKCLFRCMAEALRLLIGANVLSGAAQGFPERSRARCWLFLSTSSIQTHSGNTRPLIAGIRFFLIIVHFLLWPWLHSN